MATTEYNNIIDDYNKILKSNDELQKEIESYDDFMKFTGVIVKLIDVLLYAIKLRKYLKTLV